MKKSKKGFSEKDKGFERNRNYRKQGGKDKWSGLKKMIAFCSVHYDLNDDDNDVEEKVF